MILYFKQAWNLIRQEKLFSAVYIIGTGLSITMVMVLSIVLYLKIANIYPETNRDRMLVVGPAAEVRGEEDISRWSLSYRTVTTCFYPIENAEAVTAVFERYMERYVQSVASDDQWPVVVRYVDHNFWRVFPFRFVGGKPFTEADWQSGIYTAVITETLSRKVFGTTEAEGRYINLDFRPYRVAGVVKDASMITSSTYADMWIPYTLMPDYQREVGEENTVGPFKAYLLAPSSATKDIEQVRREAQENVRKYNSSMPENVEFSISSQPDLYWQSLFRTGYMDINFLRIGMIYGLIFLVLLIVPAINLSGMTDSRIERRLAEFGVRRAFGAHNIQLLRQILYENVCFSLMGGLIGLLWSYLFIIFGRSWIMQIGQNISFLPPEGTEVIITPGMLLNIPVFLIALALCFLMNFLSAFVPAWRASKREIVYSINTKF